MSEPRDRADENEQQAVRLRLEAERIREGRAATIEQAAREALAAVSAGDVLEAAEVLLWASRALRSSIREPGSLEESAAGLEGLARRQRESGLTSEHGPNTFDPMNAIPTDALRSKSALSEDALKHPFVAAFTKRNESIPDVADWLSEQLKRKVPRSTVQSWYKDPKDPSWRPIPEDAEILIRERYRVPRSAWHRVQGAPRRRR